MCIFLKARDHSLKISPLLSFLTSKVIFIITHLCVKLHQRLIYRIDVIYPSSACIQNSSREKVEDSLLVVLNREEIHG